MVRENGRVVGAATVARRTGEVRQTDDRLGARVGRQRVDVPVAEDRFHAGLEVGRAGSGCR